MLTITTRLTLWYLAVFGGIFILVVVVMYNIFAADEYLEIDREMREYSAVLLHGKPTEKTTIAELFQQLDSTASGLLRFKPMNFFLSNRNGVELGGVPQSLLDPLSDSAGLDLQQIPHIPFQTIRLGDINYRIYIRSLARTVPDDMSLVVVRPLDRVQGILGRLLDLIWTMIPLALIAAGVGGWFMARRALAPIARITATAEEISSSSLDRRVPTSASNDELAALANTLNRMIERLERTFNAQHRFVADASHDLRTPLTIIQAEIELLLKKDLDEEVRSSLRLSLDEINRLSQLASNLLMLARIDANQFTLSQERTRLDEFLVDCISRISSLAGRRNLSLQVDISEPVEIMCDPAMLRRAIINILDNAIKYSPPSSVLQTKLMVNGATTSISINDNGPGIDSGELPRIFDRFYRSDRTRNTSGTGLGLSITKTIVEAHGGDLVVASGSNGGTRVTITLPMS